MALFFALRRTYMKIKSRVIKPQKLKAEIELTDPNAATVVNYKRRYQDHFGKLAGEDLSSYDQNESASDFS